MRSLHPYLAAETKEENSPLESSTIADPFPSGMPTAGQLVARVEAMLLRFLRQPPSNRLPVVLELPEQEFPWNRRTEEDGGIGGGQGDAEEEEEDDEEVDDEEAVECVGEVGVSSHTPESLKRPPPRTPLVPASMLPQSPPTRILSRMAIIDSILDTSLPGEGMAKL